MKFEHDLNRIRQLSTGSSAMHIRQAILVTKNTLVSDLKKKYSRCELCLTLLLRNVDRFGYYLSENNEMVKAGESVIIYSVNTNNPDELHAANSEFNDRFYGKEEVSEAQGLWPDEALIIGNFLADFGASVLEICCGNGRITSHLVKQGNSVVGLDTSNQCIKLAKTKENQFLQFLVGNAYGLPFDDRQFDYGICLENSLGIFFRNVELVLDQLINVSSRRVILGLRRVEGRESNIHYYFSSDGFMEFTTVFTRVRFEETLANLSDSTRSRVRGVNFYPGLDRPWGGRLFYVVLDLD